MVSSVVLLGLQVSILGLEMALNHYSKEPTENPFDLKSVPLAAQPVVEQQSGMLQRSFSCQWLSYLYVYECICVRLYACICMCMYVQCVGRVCVYLCVYICVCIFVCVSMYVCVMCICGYVCAYFCIYV